MGQIRWIAACRAAIRGAIDDFPFSGINGKRLYLHVFAWPFRHIHLEGMAGRVEYAQLLNDASEVPFKEAGATRNWDEMGLKPDSVMLYLPVEKPNAVVPVVEIFLKD